MKKKRILTAEDHAFLRDGMLAMLAGKDFGTTMEEMFEKDLAEWEEMTLEQ